jgi:hypothetical protein
MQMSDAQYLAQKPSYRSVALGADGVWASTGAHALRASIEAQSPRGVTDLLRTMDAHSMAMVLREVGFQVDSEVIPLGREALYKSVKPELQAALQTGKVGVQKAGVQAVAQAQASAQQEPQQTQASPAPSSALEVIQKVMQSSQVKVSTLGDVPLPQRASLQMLAGQALKKGVLGFGFDGIPGKFMLSGTMAEVVELHRDAASEIAMLSTKAGLQEWAAGTSVKGLSEWVPDSVQRLLHGSVSMEAAQVVVSGLNTGTIARHAEEYGIGGITSLLAAQGLDPKAPTIIEHAEEMGLVLKPVDKERGQYFGTVVAQDHRASLVKVNTREVIELPFAESAGPKPRVGESLRVGFKAGVLSVTTTNSVQADRGR